MIWAFERPEMLVSIVGFFAKIEGFPYSGLEVVTT
jgi:hypothetical protein